MHAINFYVYPALGDGNVDGLEAVVFFQLRGHAATTKGKVKLTCFAGGFNAAYPVLVVVAQRRTEKIQGIVPYLFVKVGIAFDTAV